MQFDAFGNEVKRVAFDAISTVTNVLSAVSGKKLHVVAGQLALSATGTAVWKSNTTAITGTMTLAQGVPLDLAGLATAAGEALTLTCTTGTGSGWLEYVEI